VSTRRVEARRVWYRNARRPNHHGLAVLLLAALLLLLELLDLRVVVGRLQEDDKVAAAAHLGLDENVLEEGLEYHAATFDNVRAQVAENVLLGQRHELEMRKGLFQLVIQGVKLGVAPNDVVGALGMHDLNHINLGHDTMPYEERRRRR